MVFFSPTPRIVFVTPPHCVNARSVRLDIFQMSVTEWLSAAGLPARVLGRLPLFVRYALNPGRSQSEYGKRRYHNYHLRIWLRLDIQELEAIEDIIDGTDEELDSFRKSRLSTASTTGAVVSSIWLSIHEKVEN
jgi:hypothetical protein